MAQHFTGLGTNTVAASAQAILIQANSAATGAITVTNGGSTQYGTSSGTVAVITNPLAGAQYKYGGLAQQGAIGVNISTSCDITVTLIDHIN